MKARHCQALALAAMTATLAVAAAPAGLAAQGIQRTPPPDVPRMMIPALKGSEKNLGVQASDAIRSRLNQDISYRSLYVIPKSDIVAMLEGSGYPANEPLAPNDAVQLAKLVRADEYLEGTVTKVPAGFRIESRLVLARDNSLVQPLPPVEGARLDLVSKALSTELQAARKQLDAEKNCVKLARENKYKEAVAAAQAGVAAYPQATLARVCIAQAYQRLNYGPDSIVKISREILAVHPNNRQALGLIAEAQMAKGDTSAAIGSYTQLLATDQSNSNLVERVVAAIAGSGRADVALPIIDKAVADNPGDTKLLDLQFRLNIAAKNWKGAVAAGDQLGKLDTSLVDTTYFQRMAVSYLSDSQPQKAAEVMARAVAKYPNNAGAHLYYASILRSGGQLPQAIAETRRALQLDPKVEKGVAQVVQLYADMNQSDSAFTVLRTAAMDPAAQNCVKTVADSTKGEWVSSCKKLYDETVFLSQYALKLGNDAYKAASADKKPESYQRAIKWLALSDTVSGSDQAKFLMGASYVSYAQPTLQAAQTAKNCEQARSANDALVQAQILLPRGGKFAPQAAGQLIQYSQQLLPYSEQLIKSVCK